MSSEPAVRHLLDLADLPDSAIDTILAGPAAAARLDPTTVIGLLFLSPSLRTRFGYAAAAARLGATPLMASELRGGATMSASESLADTLRAVAGMSDLVVVRSAEPLNRPEIRAGCPVPVINGGDAANGHPTQALIDLAAMERFAGPVGGLRVALCGDLTMRASRSLLELLTRRPPARLCLIAPPTRSEHGVDLNPIADRVEVRQPGDFADLDVVVMTGLPPGGTQPGAAHLDASIRAGYALDEHSIGSLPARAIVLSPMPIIDEISPAVRVDRRMRLFEQSDLGVSIRMAVLLYALSERSASHDGSRR